MNDFILKLPKAELHVHLEGTLEPELAFILAERNGVQLPFKSPAALRAAYNFKDLSSFLSMSFTLGTLLKTEHDFYVLTTSYLEKALEQGVLHTEIAFEVQTYIQRDISIKTILNGMNHAVSDIQKQHPISVQFILTFLRDRPEAEALAMLEESVHYKKYITAIGLASTELGNPPSKFKTLFAKAREYGYRLTAHAGEEAGPEYIWQAVNLLHVERIDHGIQCLDDPHLVQVLKERAIPLTVCPLSNVALKAVSSLINHPVKRMLDAGLRVSLHSDDPAYFHGYIGDIYIKTQEALKLPNPVMIHYAYNSILSSFITQEQKDTYLNQLYAYLDAAGTRKNN